MSGGKGGSQTTEVKVPQYIEDAAKANLARADEISRIGYTPYYGPDVAAFSPMQQASFQNTADAASAFGMSAPTTRQDIMGGMPAPTTYAGGVSGYSSAPMYEQSLAQFQAQRPGQYDAIMSQFIDPVAGTAPSAASLSPAPTGQGNPSAAGSGGEGRDAGYDSYGGVGYTGVRDMFDGGGPNASTIGGRNFAGPNPDGSAGNDGGAGCVVATHAVESGAFTPTQKREAVVWCMNVLHGKWWGEAVRRGYRHLGRKKIEQGKAREHYAEFSRYIQFANGKKRDVRGALTFALRTAQFFAVGIVKKDA
jgi:hypothetical protein